ncbi:ABC transporter permease [Consotaella salsifontis]|uniref:Putative ABC transport system permease protein n=1 Tax=Consotaella salsifontis TaxID=1365950 RepID=A0A1T4TAB0_9HYPH|nr:ABC transporter permease [Consotaella salsifontis]SKA37326.1 putative ABC transport system permease protein [Consotaella salsifontis]
MNLALRDIRFGLPRFLLTVAGVGFLITASVGMVGLYRGIVDDALLVIDTIGADLWVVQGGRSGPFAEGSSVPSTMDRRVEGLAGVASVRRFVQFSQQFDVDGRNLRASITGLDYPADTGEWLRLSDGRYLASGHFEAIADASIGLGLGDVVHLGQDDFRIVGLTNGMVDVQGDGLLFVTINDAVDIAKRRTDEEVLLARAKAGGTDAAAGANSSVPQESKIAAVLVSLDPAADQRQVAAAVLAWGDANVLSQADQHNLLLNQRLWRLRVQILAFTVVLLVVMAIVISLIIYTMTIEKLHQIAMLKLIGARNSIIIAMIAEQAALIGVGGFGFGLVVSKLVFPHFPRRIVMDTGDLALLFTAVALICGVASLLGIVRALKVRAQEVLS